MIENYWTTGADDDLTVTAVLLHKPPQMKVVVEWMEFNHAEGKFEVVDSGIYPVRETSRSLIVEIPNALDKIWKVTLPKYNRMGRKNNQARKRWGIRDDGRHIIFQWSPCEYAVY